MKAAQAAGAEAPQGARSVKVVLVGDGGCGKTSLLMVFAEGAFPESYTPTVFERLAVNLQMKGKPLNLQIWDTAGQVDYDRLRPLFYPDASVLLLCFDVTSPHSFDNIFNRWYPEVNHFCKEVPIIVVGCKTDLRKDKLLVKKLRKNRARRWRGPWVQWPTSSAQPCSKKTSTRSSRKQRRWPSAAAVATSGGGLPGAVAW
ncbi:rho-related GTP-binding protein RhoD isoform X2 [Mirounga angustirostris]|uniref:Rho-related GTP-binding protein RhoD isoform X2 n=1 Tax=Neomonachus schauinslandi TaxID=29088 RepID=A0A2Y9GU46_NEOSC|nr:rho-related GTP-binding protein RhoD isoform X2 [Neomonachus schauinslandi]XP_034869261.1 rho-related GTP-binding protein RhoD isoform X2 [Mirounga leonina]